MKISKIENAGPNAETLYAIAPTFWKGMGILVEKEAPTEAHEYAKHKLLERYKNKCPGIVRVLNRIIVL